MTTYYEIPLSAKPQNFNITLAGVQYQFLVTWNVINASWMISISDSSGNPIVSGIPMVTGADLLGQFGYLGFGFQLVAQTDSDPNSVPTFSDLGSTGHLYAIVP